MPGIYIMEVYAEGYAPREVDFAIVEKNPTILNITLRAVSTLVEIVSSGIKKVFISSGIKNV